MISHKLAQVTMVTVFLLVMLSETCFGCPSSCDPATHICANHNCKPKTCGPCFRCCGVNWPRCKKKRSVVLYGISDTLKHDEIHSLLAQECLATCTGISLKREKRQNKDDFTVCVQGQLMTKYCGKSECVQCCRTDYPVCEKEKSKRSIQERKWEAAVENRTEKCSRFCLENGLDDDGWEI